MTVFSSTYHVKIPHMLNLHSPTMTISAASSEMRLPHKNHHRYKTSAAAQSTGTSTTTIYLARSPQFVVFLENESHHHYANFVTFFVMAWPVGKSTFFPIGKNFNAMHPVPWFQSHSTSISPWFVDGGHSQALVLHRWGTSSCAPANIISAVSLRKKLSSADTSPILHRR